MPSFKLLLVALLALIACRETSQAATVKAFTAGNWAGGAIINDKSKQFEYCAATSKFEGGLTMSYTVDRRWAWKVAFSSPNWGFTVGHVFNVTLKIGDEQYPNQRGVVTGGQSFEMQVGDPIALFERLRTGRSLRVQVGGLSLGLDLADSDEAMYALAHCVALQLPRRPAPRTPSAAGARPLQLTPPADADARRESQALVKDLMAQIGLSDYRLVAATEVPFAYRPDAVWKKGPLAGTVSILPTERAAPPENLANDILLSGSQSCRDRFVLIAASETIDQSVLSRIFTLCRSPDGPVTTYYLLVPRPDGGSYLVATINTGLEFLTSRPAEQLDDRIRPLIVGVVARQKQTGSDSP